MDILILSTWGGLTRGSSRELKKGTSVAKERQPCCLPEPRSVGATEVTIISEIAEVTPGLASPVAAAR